ncbi:MAG TPA: hypothetical protein VFP92_07835 [Rhodanobacteraceae bacterium]|nr:hypothetical protein [Rhodanobacteraceae bacterium]
MAMTLWVDQQQALCAFAGLAVGDLHIAAACHQAQVRGGVFVPGQV